METPRAGTHYPRSEGEFRSWFRTDADCLDTAKTIAAVAREACDAVVLLVSTADFIRRKAAIDQMSGEGT